MMKINLNPIPYLNQNWFLPIRVFGGELGYFYAKFNSFYSPIPMIYPAAKSININTRIFTPLSRIVHRKALVVGASATQARQSLCLLYLAKPLDRIIQALVNPLFKAADVWSQTSHYCGNLVVPMVLTIVLTPIVAALGIIESIGLISNAIFQLVIPYQMLYAVVKGQEASKEFFDLQSEIKTKRVIRNNDDTRSYKTPIFTIFHEQIEDDIRRIENVLPQRRYSEIARDSKGNPGTLSKAVHTAHKIISYLPLWPLNLLLCVRPRVLLPGLRRIAIC